jgi:hypothetical protein
MRIHSHLMSICTTLIWSRDDTLELQGVSQLLESGEHFIDRDASLPAALGREGRLKLKHIHRCKAVCKAKRSSLISSDLSRIEVTPMRMSDE